ncbi:hypothetical protein P4B35_22980 [Pontiellaceae bacterium B12227]|nr:hypothetical protein [Pontiellaceae bacterium B12227]
MKQSKTLIVFLLVHFGLVLVTGFADEPSILDEATQPEALRAQIEKAQETVRKYKGGHVIVGRVLLDGPGDARDVKAQMQILKDGYFAGATKDLVRPVGFRMHGYAPYDLELKGRSGAIVDVGTIRMNKLPADELLKLKGKVELEGLDNPESALVRLSVRNARANTPHNGTSPRPRWPAPIEAEVKADGTFYAEGFSPIKYDCTVQAPGHVQQSLSITFKEGIDRDLGTVRLEQPIEISLTYIVADKPPFDLARKRNAVLSGGARWKATEDTYGWDLEFKQRDGGVYFDYSYAPCYMIDLGEGSIQEVLEMAARKVPKKQPRQEEVRSGHVYLMNQAHWKHWVLFEVEIK